MPRFKFFTPNQTHVIELYSSGDKYIEQVEHEIISGSDAGPLLTEIFGQNVRFVYVPDGEKFNGLLNEAKKREHTQSIINLYEPENTKYLLDRINPGDSILINAQGDIHNKLIAGYDAEELIDILENDLELEKIPLNNLDIDSCKMGRVKSYREELKAQLKNFQTITTYTDLCTASKRDNVPRRMWIEEDGEEHLFYDESELNKKGTRIIEYTDVYKNLMTNIWKANPYNLHELDLSENIGISVSASFTTL
ncbi:hypothetical protein J2N86_14620 (plasmid) [Legionella lytica]|uniref:Uncharacterized protein n=1 Tax=Legionella lytica TaxID=96232 RepID=A0ABY4YDF5_9GAMM|nr:hypothetical protein [Legionella lytica]USQ15471.1 hypothetical protein J2N86_14620 [Legionella lytica]